MTKTELVKGMQAFTGGGFINRDELKKFLGYKDSHSIAKFLCGLERVGNRYFIPDVAEQIIHVSRGR